MDLGRLDAWDDILARLLVYTLERPWCSWYLGGESEQGNCLALSRASKAFWAFTAFFASSSGFMYS